MSAVYKILQKSGYHKVKLGVDFEFTPRRMKS